jgi:predicted anti-sigma-YlaC factor YlaD
MRCEDLRELAPEIALGIADGEQRETAMRHLADCDECRHLLEEMSEVNDELLRRAPLT